MKGKREGFHFRGFVALADTLFAVSAGLLLLNPIKFEAKPAEKGRSPAQKQEAEMILLEIEQLEERLDRLERSGRYLQKQAIETLKNE